ncbi:MAG: dTDP-glucose 4,6-dehydratase [Bacteroidota bacterium]|jgi:dTDP-glucose 4,6-dehydratase
MKLLITGGAGFIGAHVLHHFCKTYPEYEIYCLDSLSYAAQYEHIEELEALESFNFIKADLNDAELLNQLFTGIGFTHIIHLAAESHVDNSINDPLLFARTNVMGTLNLLEAARTHWMAGEDHLFYHISTDEVFGALGVTGQFKESTAYDPRSPYSASKASSDHFVRAYHHTYGLPVVISNCSNNYGPFQHDEKLIPTVIRSIVNQKPIPIYGDGSNVRDWLYVKDHVAAIDRIFHSGQVGETYCIGGDAERSNLDLVNLLIELTDEALGNAKGHSEPLISFVTDRKGHDFRYAIDHSNLTESLGWTPSTDLKDGLRQTVAWYCEKYR